MTVYDQAQNQLKTTPRRWLVTGAAGFIGSHLVQTLLELDQAVVGLDNFSTGTLENLDHVSHQVGSAQWKRFRLIEGDIRQLDVCLASCRGVDFVLHQAALGSVTRSIEDPMETNESNVTGFLNMLVAARDGKVKRFIYASSSSVYGDCTEIPATENRIGIPLSPYAVSKRANELYAAVFASAYGIETIGLRYFNVFGPRQDPNGAYAAVIPRWIAALKAGETVTIYGDGTTSRDFCYVANAVQANILAAICDQKEAISQVFNVALNQSTTLNQLFVCLRDKLSALHPSSFILHPSSPLHLPPRSGDIRHSLADISKAQRLLAYQPTHTLEQGLDEML